MTNHNQICFTHEDVTAAIERAKAFWADAEDCEVTRDIRILIAAARFRNAGWAIVPREATEKMIEAWATAAPIPYPTEYHTDEDANRAWAQADWSAMTAASPLEAGR